MTINSSGTLSLGGTIQGNTIAYELRNIGYDYSSSTPSINLNSIFVRDVAGIGSGTISFSDFYGKPTYQYTGGTINENSSYTFTAPSGYIFVRVTYGWYGLPESYPSETTCATDEDGNCGCGGRGYYPNVYGATSVTVNVNNSSMGGDPCVGVPKRLTIKFLLIGGSTPPAYGTTYTSSCSGYTLTSIKHDGTFGTLSPTSQGNSPSCGYGRTVYASGQRTSGDQNNDGCAYTVGYLTGPYGTGYYARIGIYGNGSGIDIDGSTANYDHRYIFMGTTSGTYYPTPSVSGSNWSYFGTPYATLNTATKTIVLYGNNGAGSPGDTGYAYATGQVRGNWYNLSDVVQTGVDQYGNPTYGHTNYITVTYT